MTILSDNEILKDLKDGLLGIHPFIEGRLTPAGYDFACNSNTEVAPGSHKLISTSETIMLSAQILATIHMKSSLAREGMIGSFAIVDPGFKGNLTLSIFNAGAETVHLRKDEPIVHIIFYRTGTPSSNPYKGKYQNSQGIEKSKRTQ
jgi:dCTP deaminase